MRDILFDDWTSRSNKPAPSSTAPCRDRRGRRLSTSFAAAKSLGAGLALLGDAMRANQFRARGHQIFLDRAITVVRRPHPRRRLSHPARLGRRGAAAPIRTSSRSTCCTFSPSSAAPNQPAASSWRSCSTTTSCTCWRCSRCGSGTPATRMKTSRASTRCSRRCRGRNGSGQQFAADAATLMLIGTSHFEPEEWGYDKLLVARADAERPPPVRDRPRPCRQHGLPSAIWLRGAMRPRHARAARRQPCRLPVAVLRAGRGDEGIRPPRRRQHREQRSRGDRRGAAERPHARRARVCRRAAAVAVTVGSRSRALRRRLRAPQGRAARDLSERTGPPTRRTRRSRSSSTSPTTSSKARWWMRCCGGRRGTCR